MQVILTWEEYEKLRNGDAVREEMKTKMQPAIKKLVARLERSSHYLDARSIDHMLVEFVSEIAKL